MVRYDAKPGERSLDLPRSPRATWPTRRPAIGSSRSGVAARMGMVCHRRRTAQAPSQPIIERRALLECQTTVDAFGTLDVLVSNAGICPFHTFLDMPADVMRRTNEVNYYGTFYVAQAAANQMVAQGKGGAIGSRDTKSATSRMAAAHFAIWSWP